jgi:hypothetical protein
MKLAISIVALVLLALLVPFLLPGVGKEAGVDPNSNLPWQVDLDGKGGSTVFGLRPGVSTVGDVRQRFGGEMDVAIIAEPDEVGLLEGYYPQLALGFVLAKVIVTVDAKKS